MNNERLNDYICKLKILTKLEPREKIIVRERTIEVVDYTSYNWPRLCKAFNLENRWTMISKLQDFYRDIESTIDNLVNNPPSRTPEQDILFALDRLRHDLDGSLGGLRNLILTYNSNKSAVSKLETLYEEVKILSEKIKTFFSKRKTLDRSRYGGETVYEAKREKGLFQNDFDPSKPSLQPSKMEEERVPPQTKLRVRLSQGDSTDSEDSNNNFNNLAEQTPSGTQSPPDPAMASPISHDGDGIGCVGDDDTFSTEGDESPIQDNDTCPNIAKINNQPEPPQPPKTATELEKLNGGGRGKSENKSNTSYPKRAGGGGPKGGNRNKGRAR